MKKTLLTIFAVMTLAALMTGCSVFQTTASTPEQTHTLNASGTGTVYVVPDIARVSIGVNTQNEDAAIAPQREYAGRKRRYAIPDQPRRC